MLYGNVGDLPRVLLAQLPLDGSTPVLIYNSRIVNTVPTARASRATYGKVLMFGIQFITEE